MPTTIKKRCICGSSSKFPICDGKHGSQNWRCSPDELYFHPRIIISSPHYLSLAESLAHKHNLLAFHLKTDVSHCEELIILHDSDDLQPLATYAQKIHHTRRRVISIDCPSPDVLNGDPPAIRISIESMPFKQFIDAASNAINQTVSSDFNIPKRLFVSHAVKDEARIMPVINRLREHYRCTVFLCADTIPAGANWQIKIEDELRDSDVVLVMCSKNLNQSTFCAYEVGLAKGMRIPIRPILLDEIPPPIFLQHLNAPSVSRINKTRPWLNESDAIASAVFMTLEEP